MTIPREAIEKAIEGGWKNWDETDRDIFFNMKHDFPSKLVEDLWNSCIALDPTFWQCLGKALGWREETISVHEDPLMWFPQWELKARQFCALILTSQSADDFWRDILAAKQEI